MSDDPALTNARRQTVDASLTGSTAQFSSSELTDTPVIDKNTKCPQENPQLSNKLLLNVQSKSKECNKDSAYFEDPDESPSPGYDSLTKRILKIINPDESPKETYCYTYHNSYDEHGEDHLLVDDGIIDVAPVTNNHDSLEKITTAEPHVASAIDVSSSPVNNTPEPHVESAIDVSLSLINNTPEPHVESAIDVSSSPVNNTQEPHVESAIDVSSSPVNNTPEPHVESAIDVSSSPVNNTPEPHVESAIDVSSSPVNNTPEPHAKFLTINDHQNHSDIQEKGLNVKSDSVSKITCDKQQGFSVQNTKNKSGDIATDKSKEGCIIHGSNTETNKSKSPSLLPECDWFLPVPVWAYYAHDNIGQLTKEADNDFVAFLLYLTDVHHIDDWLRYNLEPGYHVLQTADLSGVISLTRSKESTDQLSKSDNPQHRWPWNHDNRLLIHLHPLDDDLLQAGDTYLCIQASAQDTSKTVIIDEQDVSIADLDEGRESHDFDNDQEIIHSGISSENLDNLNQNAECLCLMLCTKDTDKQSSYPLWQCDYSQLFTMDFVNNVTMKDPDDLAELLKHCLIAVETCTEQLAIKSSLKPCGSCSVRNEDTKCGYHSGSVHDNTNNNCEDSVVKPRILPMYDKYKDEPLGHSAHALGRSRTTVSDLQDTPMDSKSTENKQYCAASPSPSNTSKHKRRQTHRAEARSVHHRTADGQLLKAEPPPCTHTIPIPVTVEHLHQEALLSGAVLYPGCQDIRGAAVVIVFCCHPAWSKDLTSQELAKILLYYYTVPRDEVSHKGLTVIADARGTSLPVLNAFLQSLYTVEANLAGAVYISHVLADRVAQSLLFRSPVFRPQVNLRIDLVMSLETLYKFVSAEHLCPELGGYLVTNHVSWVHYRQKLEQFLRHCRDVGELLMELMQKMSAVESLPSSAPDASHQVKLHKQCVAQTLQGNTIVSLRQQGHSLLSNLSSHQQDLHNNEDFRSSFLGAERLYNQLQNTSDRLILLADDRLQRLQTCNERHLLETEMSELLMWLSIDGAAIMERHSDIADNLKGIKNQQKDFEKAYFSAMTQLGKGSDLLEEVNTLSQSEGSSGVMTGLKDMSADLKEHMTQYIGRLEDVREKIEETSRCYHLLDKSYEWALNAMKYAANVKTDKTSSAESIEKQLRSFDIYREQNQPVDVSTFEMMLKLSRKLENEKLYNQCTVARTRCMETEQLLQERTAKLRQVKEKLENTEAQHMAKATEVELTANEDNTNSGLSDDMGHTSSSNTTMSTNTPISHNISDLSRTSDNSCSELHSPSRAFASKDMYMSHLMSVLRRRSYAGKPSAPLYSPGVAAFKDNMRDMNLWEYEEYLFNEGLITEDMSDRIVAFLPKGLSDSTMRGSRESLRGSMENLSQIVVDSPPQEPRSSSHPCDLSAATKDNSKTTGATIAPSLNPTLNKHHRPHRKMLKKTNSCSLPETGATELLPSIREKRDIRSMSMITGSRESLPCMPEEDLLDGSESSQPREKKIPAQVQASTPSPLPINTERKFGWSPVPVNTHLMYRNNRPSTLSTSHSMADLRITEEQVKQRRTLSLILHEMIQTERDYVRSIQFIIDNYIPEISRSDVPQTLRGKRSIIFGNIEKIYEFHNLHFLADLEKCQANPYTVCHAFLKHDQEFFLYALYNKNKPKSDALMAEYGMTYFRKKQTELGDRMDLNSYLLKPVQRMGKYALLLKQIIQECAETDQEYNDLNAALEMVKFLLRHGNDLLAMDCLKDCDVNLQEQGMLLRQDEFLVWQGRRKCLRHVFLFEEMVLFSKTKRTSYGQDLYVYKSTIKTSDLGLTESVSDSKHKFEIWFRKRTAGGTFTLQAPTMDVKHSWVKEISMLLWKQAFRNRERRLSDAARMGIGRKPCMDLKPSQHNIYDRFINISIAGQRSVPRMRNSIAVSSFDHLRNGSKRPHSLISVSSSSSGGSNQSSHSGGSVHVSTSMGALDIVHEDHIVPDMSSNYAFTADHGLGASDLNATISSMEDACTQTTLKRPIKHKERQNVDDPDEHISSTHLQLQIDNIRTTDV